MDTLIKSQSPSMDIQVKQEPSPPIQDKISAYYSLVFPHFTFYVQTLSVTIGRRCAPNLHGASSSTAELVQVDVDLGSLKSVSRLHAKIEYDHDEDRFVLVVVGRNGAWVDGVWCASGTRTSLGERSQIQIASRMFQFVLPPPPSPEDSPSPSSHSSGAARHRSPSLDIETISPPSSQPPNSPPPIEHKLPSPPPEPRIKSEPNSHPKLPNSNLIGKSIKAGLSRAGAAVNSKKRKKTETGLPRAAERPRPEEMPSKPPFTYAQLIFKAIKAIGGKATLQEICTWVSHTYDYYKYADSSWMSSIRHNLSSGRAFLKMERCGGDRGKGFFWTIDGKHAQALEEQELKAKQAMVNGSARGPSGGKEGTSKGRKKDKGASLLKPSLKRSVKDDLKGLALPPPLTNTPLAFKTTNAITAAMATASGNSSSSGPTAVTGSGNTLATNGITSSSPPTTGVFAYPSHSQASPVATLHHGSAVTRNYSGSNPYAALTQSHWSGHRPTSEPIAETSVMPRVPAASMGSSTSQLDSPGIVSPTGLQSSQSQHVGSQDPSPTQQHQQPTVPDVIIPIVLGPIPPTHPDYSPTHRNNSAKEGYMVLHERKLILDPDVFSELTSEMLTELETMGARAALRVLTGHMVRALKEKRAREREKSREKGGRRGRGPGRGQQGVTAPVSGVPHGSHSSHPISSQSTKISVGRSDVGTARSANIDEGDRGEPAQEMEDRTVPETLADPASPLIVVVDSEDEGPVTKKRKVEDEMQVP